MPIYEYKCPNGHVFELFQRMSDRSPRGLRGLRRGPLERVLYPVAGALQGLGLLLDRLRPRLAKRRGEGRRRRASGSTSGRRLADEEAEAATKVRLGGRQKAGRPAASERALTSASGCADDAAGPEGPDPGGGGCGGGSPVNIAITSGCPRRDDHRLAADGRRARRRAGSAAPCPSARGTSTQPSWMSCPRERSVASGFSSSSPMNGSRRTCRRRSACARPPAPRLLARAARDVGLGRVELVLADARVDQRPPAVHVLPALGEAPALPCRTALRLERAVEPVREDRLRHVDVDAADRVDQVLEARSRRSRRG